MSLELGFVMKLATFGRTMFMREHSRLAVGLNQVIPHWGDERLYQVVQRIIIVELSNVNFNANFVWSPNSTAIGLGGSFGLYINYYDQNLRPMTFAKAAVPHTQPRSHTKSCMM